MAKEKILKDHPSLSELLEKRGVTKNAKYDDYQDYIEKRESEGLLPTLLGIVRIPVEGSMHLAVGKVHNVRTFWSAGDRR